jgi:exodeoxyribonuclease VII large subunit
MADQPGFFETRARLSSQRPAIPATPTDALTPSQLNRLVEQTLKAHLPTTLLVRGEVSNFNRNRQSGHLYFAMKDGQGCLDAVMWASRAERLRFEPRDGMELLATGSLGVYVPRGRYQLVVHSLDPVGEGALEVARRQLEERLRKLGLFDVENKRPIPAFPQTIALITSPQAAGFADMLKVLARCPWLRLMLYPVPVQGAAAAPAIATALNHLSERQDDVGGIDLILLGRGGGSLEDLWAFNDEAVVRAVAACDVPVITGIGHETDVSLADLAADYHAHTPTEAATLVVRNWSRVDDTLDAASMRLRREARQRIADARQQLMSIERHELFRRPGSMFESTRQRLDDHHDTLRRSLAERLTKANHQLERAAAVLAQHPPARRLKLEAQRLDRLTADFRSAASAALKQRHRTLIALDAQLRLLGPANVLKRGYSITTQKRTGAIIRTPTDVRAGDKLITRLADGSIESTAADPKQPELF